MSSSLSLCTSQHGEIDIRHFVSGCSIRVSEGDVLTILSLLEDYEHVAHVRHLDGSHSPWDDDHCKRLLSREKTHFLRHLSLNSCLITFRGFEHLMHLKDLRSLELQKNSIGSDAGVYLQSHNSLTDLKIGGSSIGEASMLAIARNTMLKSVAFDFEYSLSDRVLISLLQNSSIRSLSLIASNMNANRLKLFTSFTNLRTLNLGLNPVMADGIAVLQHCASITSLSLASAMITDSAMKTIALMSSLVALDLSRNAQLSVEGMKELRECSSLTDLCLDGDVKIGDEGVRVIATLPSLTALSVQGICMMSETAEALANLSTLRCLTAGARLVDDFFNVISASTSIVTIQFYDRCPRLWSSVSLLLIPSLVSISSHEPLYRELFHNWALQTKVVSLDMLPDSKWTPEPKELVALQENYALAFLCPTHPEVERFLARNRQIHSQNRRDLLEVLQHLAVDPLNLSMRPNAAGWWKLPRDIREAILIMTFCDDRTRLMGKHPLQVKALIKFVLENASEIRRILADRHGTVLLERRRWHRGMPVIEMM